MKNNKSLHGIILTIAFLAYSSINYGQVVNQLEGTTEFILDSDTGQPQLRLVEDDPASSSRAHIEFTTAQNPGESITLRATTNGIAGAFLDIIHTEPGGTPTQGLFWSLSQGFWGIRGGLRFSGEPVVDWEGTIKYNSTDNVFQGYDGSEWKTFNLWGTDVFGPTYMQNGPSYASIYSSDNSAAGIGFGGSSGGIQSTISYFPLSSRMNITSNATNNNMLVLDGITGRIGINTLSPDAQLEVASNSTGTTPTLRLEETEDNDYTRLFFTNLNNTNDRWSIAGNTGTTDSHIFGLYYNGIVRWAYNENMDGLGIGTDMPDQLLHLDFNGSNGVKIEGDGGGDARLWIDNQGGNHYLFDDASSGNAFTLSSANDLVIKTDGTERMRINKLSGEVQIGGINSSSRFYVENDFETYTAQASASGSGLKYAFRATVDTDNGSSNKFGLVGQVNNNMGTGNAYGVYGSADAANSDFYGVYSNGNMHYTGTLTNSSDISVKKNVEDMPPVLEKVMQLDTKIFEFDNDNFSYANFPQGRQHGFIAQNVQEVFPTLVVNQNHSFENGTDKETGDTEFTHLDILGMKTMEMIPILTKALQEQQYLIQKQQEQIDVLAREIEMLKSDK